MDVWSYNLDTPYQQHGPFDVFVLMMTEIGEKKLYEACFILKGH
jgi:hypothetical protein